MSITASIVGSIKITDNLTGSVSLSKVVNNAYTGTLQSYGQSVIVGTGTTTVSLPTSPVLFVYVRNLSTTAGTTVTVSWTPNTGSSATILTLDAGALILFSELTTTEGVTSLTMTSNQAGTPVEYILAG